MAAIYYHIKAINFEIEYRILDIPNSINLSHTSYDIPIQLDRRISSGRQHEHYWPHDVEIEDDVDLVADKYDLIRKTLTK